MKKNHKFSLVLILSFLVLTAVNAQKSYDLKYNLDIDDKYQFVTNLNQDVSFEANGQTMTLEQELMFDMLTTVVEIKEGNIKQEVIFEKINMRQAIFGMEIIYDSEDESTWTGMGEQIAKQFNTYIGQTISYVIDEKGNFKDMDLGTIADSDELTSNLKSGNSYAVYPEGKVRVGDSWDTDIEPMKDNDMKVHMKYTLLKANKKQAIIAVEGKISASNLSAESMTLDGNTSGEMIVDMKTGMLIQSDMEMEFIMEMEKDGVKFPATISSSSVTTTEKK